MQETWSVLVIEGSYTFSCHCSWFDLACNGQEPLWHTGVSSVSILILFSFEKVDDPDFEHLARTIAF